MAACCAHARAAGRVVSFLAPRYRRRFARKGFEPSQRQLLDGLQDTGYAGASLLEIGCGLGHLHQALLERGARSAVGIDLAPRMIAEAAAAAKRQGLSDRTAYVEGDFLELDATIEPADVTLLDKVVCCYPDAEGLLGRSLAKTRRACALVYPRNRWFVRLGAMATGAVMWALRSDFRTYVHDPHRIEAFIQTAGLRKRYEDRTAAWHAQVWVRG